MGFAEILVGLVVVFIVIVIWCGVWGSRCKKHEFVLTHFKPYIDTSYNTEVQSVSYTAICKHCKKLGVFPGATRLFNRSHVYGCDITDRSEFIKYVR